jgi:hypothetical protein
MSIQPPAKTSLCGSKWGDPETPLVSTKKSEPAPPRQHVCCSELTQINLNISCPLWKYQIKRKIWTKKV